MSNCLLINSPSIREPEGGVVPEGRHSLEILSGASYAAFERRAHLSSEERGEEYETFVKELGDQLLSTLEHYIPQLSRHIEFMDYITPLTLEKRINLVRGGIYGPELTPDQVGPGRFPDGTCGVEGLFLAGAGSMGSSVHYCVRSGIQSGRKAVDFLKAD